MKNIFQRTSEITVPFQFEIVGDTLYLKGLLTLSSVEDYLSELESAIRKYTRKILQVNLSDVTRLDSAGVVTLRYLQQKAEERGIRLSYVEIPEHIRRTLDAFTIPESALRLGPEIPSFWENIGGQGHHFFTRELPDFIFMMADIFYWSAADLFHSRAHRKGEFIRQAALIGVNAVPIITLISFLIGLVLALQSAQQLRLFGANMFIADLVVVAMTREMGPLITAIMIAGRSGSSIASEIATMVVTEEVDALKTMAINPLRYLVVPKMHAAITMLPLLTILANVFGIAGGMLIAYWSLDLAPNIFFNRMVDVLYLRDIITGIVKSVVFAGAIVITGSFLGFRATGGPESVGRTTTQAVVVSIFLVILADSVLGLIFY